MTSRVWMWCVLLMRALSMDGTRSTARRWLGREREAERWCEPGEEMEQARAMTPSSDDNELRRRAFGAGMGSCRLPSLARRNNPKFHPRKSLSGSVIGAARLSKPPGACHWLSIAPMRHLDHAILRATPAADSMLWAPRALPSPPPGPWFPLHRPSPSLPLPLPSSAVTTVCTSRRTYGCQNLHTGR